MIVPPLHVITDDEVLARPHFLAGVREILEAGGQRVAVHLRGHRTSARLLHALAVSVVDAARETGSLVFVNDRADIARAAGASGVQLGGGSLHPRSVRSFWPEARIGRSLHTAEEVAETDRDGTDFVILGTIWASPTHPERPGSGPGLIERCVAATSRPVIAICGVTADRVGAAKLAGAAGIATIGAVWRADRPAINVRRLLAAWDHAPAKRRRCDEDE